MKFIPHVLDAIVVTCTPVVVATTTVLADTGTVTQADNELRLFLLPLIGALLVCGGLIMLNPQLETRRIVIGRSMFGLFLGVVAPQVVGMVHPAMQMLVLKPFPLCLIGGGIAGLAYVLSRPFTRQLYARADAVAQREAQRLEERLSPAAQANKPPEV